MILEKKERKKKLHFTAMCENRFLFAVRLEFVDDDSDSDNINDNDDSFGDGDDDNEDDDNNEST